MTRETQRARIEERREAAEADDVLVWSCDAMRGGERSACCACALDRSVGAAHGAGFYEETRLVGNSRRQRPAGRPSPRFGSRRIASGLAGIDSAAAARVFFLSDLRGLRRGKREDSGARGRGRASAGGHAVQAANAAAACQMFADSGEERGQESQQDSDG